MEFTDYDVNSLYATVINFDSSVFKTFPPFEITDTRHFKDRKRYIVIVNNKELESDLRSFLMKKNGSVARSHYEWDISEEVLTIITLKYGI